MYFFNFLEDIYIGQVHISVILIYLAIILLLVGIFKKRLTIVTYRSFFSKFLLNIWSFRFLYISLSLFLLFIGIMANKKVISFIYNNTSEIFLYLLLFLLIRVIIISSWDIRRQLKKLVQYNLGEDLEEYLKEYNEKLKSVKEYLKKSDKTLTDIFDDSKEKMEFLKEQHKKISDILDKQYKTIKYEGKIQIKELRWAAGAVIVAIVVGLMNIFSPYLSNTNFRIFEKLLKPNKVEIVKPKINDFVSYTQKHPLKMSINEEDLKNLITIICKCKENNDNTNLKLFRVRQLVGPFEEKSSDKLMKNFNFEQQICIIREQLYDNNFSLVFVIGHHDKRLLDGKGSIKTNTELAQQRANTVAEKLEMEELVNTECELPPIKVFLKLCAGPTIFQFQDSDKNIIIDDLMAGRMVEVWGVSLINL